MNISRYDIAKTIQQVTEKITLFIEKCSGKRKLNTSDLQIDGWEHGPTFFKNDNGYFFTLPDSKSYPVDPNDIYRSIETGIWDNTITTMIENTPDQKFDIIGIGSKSTIVLESGFIVVKENLKTDVEKVTVSVKDWCSPVTELYSREMLTQTPSTFKQILRECKKSLIYYYVKMAGTNMSKDMFL